jgi:hypothetical protein
LQSFKYEPEETNLVLLLVENQLATTLFYEDTIIDIFWIRIGENANFNSTILYFLHIVMKVALFDTQNRSESSTFLHHFIPFPGDDCQSIPFFCNSSFLVILLDQISQLTSICKKIVCTTGYESFFFIYCLINSGYALVNQSENS